MNHNPDEVVSYFKSRKKPQKKAGNALAPESNTPKPTTNSSSGSKPSMASTAPAQRGFSPQDLANMPGPLLAQLSMFPPIVRQNPVTQAWVTLQNSMSADEDAHFSNDRQEMENADKLLGLVSGLNQMENARPVNFDSESHSSEAVGNGQRKEAMDGKLENKALGTIVSTNSGPGQVSTTTASKGDNAKGYKKVENKKTKRMEQPRAGSEWDDPTNPGASLPLSKRRVAPARAMPALEPNLAGAVVRLHQYKQKEFYEPRTWRSWSELMQSDEAMDILQDWQPIDDETKQIILNPNIPKGPFESREQYLNIHYDLFREEAIRPIREAVAVVRQYPDGDERGNFGIYENVRISGMTFSAQGLSFEVSFSTRRTGKRVQWEMSTRLTPMSVVALSSDDFQSECIIAIVAARNLDKLNQSPPRTDLFFADPHAVEIDTQKRFVMVEERTGFFEAQRHVMVALQRMVDEPFPLEELIVYCDFQGEQAKNPPRHVANDPVYNMTGVWGEGHEAVSILEPFTINPKEALLDSSQSVALQHMFSRPLSIVQGPPGTGKTFVSVVAIKLLLQKWKTGDPPIIISCQTNHALDQLLKHVAEFEPNFARLGGRSKDETVIKPRTMYELRRAFGKKPFARDNQSVAFLKIRTIGSAIEMDIRGLIAEEDSEEDIIDHHALHQCKLITQKQFDSFESGDTAFAGQGTTSAEEDKNPLLEWLGKAVEKIPKMGKEMYLEFEEETKLDPEEVKEREAEAFTDESEELMGKYVPLNQFYKGSGPEMGSSQADNVLREQNVWKIPARLRGSLYNYLVSELKAAARKKVGEKAEMYAKEVQNYKYGKFEKELAVITDQGIKILGMTTTGLNKYRAMVQALSPKIFVIEEAAEALEAPVISGACIHSMEHLILVGDHQQLRPNCVVHDLKSEPFNLDISLFERMINNGLDFRSLKTQRRMIPEIRSLLFPIYGNLIHDHPSVLSRNKKIPGMPLNSFMWAHSEMEFKDATSSTANGAEAEMLVGMVTYLLRNGTPGKKITILTFYNAQRKLIDSLLRKANRDLAAAESPISMKGIKIATVDSYQGEENDIVLLSLVRSNNKGQLGFSGIVNRICVALSRARIGLFIFCNVNLFANASLEWNQIYSILANIASDDYEHVGYELPLKCERHGRISKIRTAKDWQRMNNGGCEQACAVILKCGHACAERCHPGDHDDYECRRQCARVIDSCRHVCEMSCHEQCICVECNPPVVMHETELRKQVDTMGSAAAASAIAAKYGMNKVLVPPNEIPVRGLPAGLEGVLARPGSGKKSPPVSGGDWQDEQNDAYEPMPGLPQTFAENLPSSKKYPFSFSKLSTARGFKGQGTDTQGFDKAVPGWGDDDAGWENDGELAPNEHTARRPQGVFDEEEAPEAAHEGAKNEALYYNPNFPPMERSQERENKSWGWGGGGGWDAPGSKQEFERSTSRGRSRNRRPSAKNRGGPGRGAYNKQYGAASGGGQSNQQQQHQGGGYGSRTGSGNDGWANSNDGWGTDAGWGASSDSWGNDQIDGKGKGPAKAADSWAQNDDNDGWNQTTVNNSGWGTRKGNRPGEGPGGRGTGGDRRANSRRGGRGGQATLIDI